MAGSAAERAPAPASGDSPSSWSDVVRRTWRRLVVFVAHWRLRLALVWSVVSRTTRKARRYYLRGVWRCESHTGRVPRNGLLLPSGPDPRPLPAPRDETASKTDAGDRSTDRSHAPSGGDRLGLPAGDCTLDVERTSDRLTISDPAHEEAYLTSTVWVEVEE